MNTVLIITSLTLTVQRWGISAGHETTRNYRLYRPFSGHLQPINRLIHGKKRQRGKEGGI